MSVLSDGARNVWDSFTRAVGAGMAAGAMALCLLTYHQLTKPADYSEPIYYSEPIQNSFEPYRNDFEPYSRRR